MYKRVNELLGTKFKSDKELNWCYISSSFFSLSESFIRKFKNKVDWLYISTDQVLSEDFIREFKDRVDWSYISSNQVLSEDFIREFNEKVYWRYISKYQLLSWNFILEFEDRVDWNYISAHQPFIDPNYEKINKKLLKKNKLYNLYQQTKDKGWFIGYSLKNNFEYFSHNITTIKCFSKPCCKVKIYWKDLKTIRKTNGSKFIREVKYV